MKNVNCRASISQVVLVSAFASMAGLADEVSAQETNAPRLEEIIVTAQKRSESLQDVPVSVTAITNENLEKFDVKNFQDYLTMVPGLTSTFDGPVSNLGVREIGLRGVQTINGTQASGQNTVGFYINNTPVPITNPRLVDIERIEVLRGPQGTLYGSSSLAGTIKVITVKPDVEAFSGFFNGGLSSTSKSGGWNYEVEGVVNIPISDKVAARVSGYYEDNAGFIDYVDVTPQGVPTGLTGKDVNDELAVGGRFELAYYATDAVSIRTALSYNSREVGAQDQYTVGAPGLTAFFPVLQESDDENYLAEFELEWDIGPGTIVSTTAYYDQKSRFLLDQSNNARLVFLTDGTNPIEIRTPNNSSHEELTHETRFVSNWDGLLQSTVGVFYSHREEITQSRIFVPGAATLLGVFPIPNETISSNYSPRKREEIAAFGTLDYQVTDQFALAFGLRYFEFDFKTFDEFFGSSLFIRNEQFTSSGRAKESGFVPRFGVEYHVSDDHLLYASAAKGFRMGGANFPLPSLDSASGACDAGLTAFFGSPSLPDSYDSDSLWSYEVGAKTSWLEDRLTLNASAFQIDWKDTQVQVQIGGLGCSFGGLSTNVGSVQSRGFEVELNAAPTENLNLIFGVSHINAEVKEDLLFPGATIEIARKGDRMPDIPDWTFSALGDYRFPINGSYDGFIRGDVRYQGNRAARFSPGNPNRAEKEDFTIANLRAGVTHNGMEISIFAENVFDERPFLLGEPRLASQTRGGAFYDNTIRPRTVGVRFSYRY